MPSQVGHYYVIPAVRQLLLCVAAGAGPGPFVFMSLPAGNVMNGGNVDPVSSGIMVDTQLISFAAPQPTFTFAGVRYRAINGYSADGTLAHLIVVLGAPLVTPEWAPKVGETILPRQFLTNVEPPGSLG